MDIPSLLSLIPAWAWVLIGLCLVTLLVFAGASLFTLLVKLGVIIGEARRPPHIDAGDYRLTQGREVRPEQERGSRTGDR
jgi:hypothetical protein